ncbi:carboxypeptidase-like regulatory domain-containing protein [Gaoshiqia sediminis]|uniref:Carboxypeptidase-like regulatory domain-containing protein n=1 Tax=Gaoshiqia sediminis TaxID=2986998 RepID=A0AA42C4Z2_9BACT|nr:carboxypeptidase-like regulatory domain-containing protein [Gaoshiqia sediminis]MCW0482283.1 carboxypeptidase-like regulatory domain-containing protein [Gaoshiqia sediminis]
MKVPGYKILMLVILLAGANSISGQDINLSGIIIEKGTQQPIEAASILFETTTIGTISDVNGNYKLWTNDSARTVVFSAPGHEQVVISLDSISSTTLNVELTKKTTPANKLNAHPQEKNARKSRR